MHLNLFLCLSFLSQWMVTSSTLLPKTKHEGGWSGHLWVPPSLSPISSLSCLLISFLKYILRLHSHFCFPNPLFLSLMDPSKTSYWCSNWSSLLNGLFSASVILLKPLIIIAFVIKTASDFSLPLSSEFLKLSYKIFFIWQYKNPEILSFILLLRLPCSQCPYLLNILQFLPCAMLSLSFSHLLTLFSLLGPFPFSPLFIWLSSLSFTLFQASLEWAFSPAHHLHTFSPSVDKSGWGASPRCAHSTY